MDQLILHWMKVRPAEQRMIAWLWMLLAIISTAGLVARVTRDVLFLSYVPLEYLPLAYLATAALTACMVFLTRQLSRSVRENRVLFAEILAVALVSILSYALFRYGIMWAILGFYVAQDVFNGLILAAFWNFSHVLLKSREAKRVFGTLGLVASCLGCLLAGILLYLVQLTASNSLLLLGGMTLVPGLLVIQKLWHEPMLEEELWRDTYSPTPRNETGHHHAIFLMLFAGATVGATTLIDFLLKMTVASHFSADQRLTFFTTIYCGSSFVASIVHLSATNRLLVWGGIRPALIALPGTLAPGAVIAFLSPSIWAMTYLEVSRLILGGGVNDTCHRLLYLLISPQRRRRLQELVSGVAQPMAMAGAGAICLLAGVAPQGLRLASGALLIALVIWLGLIHRLRTNYEQALDAGLPNRSALNLDFHSELHDVASAQTLVHELRSSDVDRIFNALELLPVNADQNWAPYVAPLLSHPESEVRNAAFRYWVRQDDPLPEAILRSWIADPDPQFRSMAIEALPAGPSLLAFFHDPSPQVQAKVAVRLLKCAPAPPLIEICLQHIECMVASLDPAIRRWAAWCLDEPHVPTDWGKLLLHDACQDVRARALQSARIGLRLDLLNDISVRLECAEDFENARDCLMALGEKALEPLIAYLTQHGIANIRSTSLLAAIRTMGSTDALQKLLLHLPSGRVMRLEFLRVAFDMRRNGPDRLVQEVEVQPLLEADILDFYRWCYLEHLIGDLQGGEALAVAFQEEAVQARERVILLVGLVHDPQRTLQLLDAVRRDHHFDLAIQLGLMEGQLEPMLLEWLLPIIEPNDLETLLARGAQHHNFLATMLLNSDASATSSPAAIGACWLAKEGDAWLEMLSLELICRTQCRECWNYVESQLSSPNVSLQHAASVTAEAIYSDQTGLLSHRAPGNSPLKQRAVPNNWTIDTEISVLSTVDKILFLKRVELFSKLSSRELIEIAEIAEQIRFDEGMTIIEEGSHGDSLFLILSGTVQITRAGRISAVMGPRECFGEMSMLDRAPRSATVIARENVSALKIDHTPFQQLLLQKHEIAMGVIKILLQRLREAFEQQSRL